MTWPCIDHSTLSPSGHVSKRARKAALERTRKELFGPDGLVRPTCPQPTKRERLLHRARELRALAARGMSTRAFNREAERLEREAQDESNRELQFAHVIMMK